MNFLAHDFVLPPGSPALTRVGSALPDIWPLLPKRPLPLVVLKRLRSEGDSAATALADGIESHLHSDAAFHGHEEFLRRVELLAPSVAAVWPGLRHAGLAAHVLVEMLLDRWLMAHEPGRLDAYYAAFTPDAIESACALTAPDDSSRGALHGMLRRFVDSAFLRDYARADGLAERFLRTIGRTSFASVPPEIPAVAALVERATLELGEGSEALLESMRRMRE